MNDLESGQKLKFPCGQWLATDEGDGQIARDLHPLQKGDQLLRASPGQREGMSPLGTCTQTSLSSILYV